MNYTVQGAGVREEVGLFGQKIDTVWLQREETMSRFFAWFPSKQLEWSSVETTWQNALLERWKFLV